MDRFTAAIVIGVLGLVAAGVVAAVAARGTETPPDLSTPGGVALAYELAVLRGDGERAWELLAESARANADRDEFLARVGHWRGSSDRSERLTVEVEEIDADRARVELTRTHGSSGGLFNFGETYSTRNTVRLVRQDGQWRISVPSEPYLLRPGP